MAYKEIIYSVDGPVAVITLNRPERMNALTMVTHTELAQAIDEADKDEKVKVIVITGAGRGFCSGDDVRDIFLSPEEAAIKGREIKIKAASGRAFTWRRP